jgi:RNA polymerase sigma-70 factor, ECF subfamily
MAAAELPGLADPSDAHLLRAIAAGDREAFAVLFGRYAVRIKGYMMRAGASDADADEIAQDVMVSIWRRAATFDPEKAAASTWIFAIARNRRIDMVRRARRGLDADDPLLYLEPEPDALLAVSAAEREERLRMGMNGLAPEQRDVLRLAFFDGLSHSEIAEATGLALGTVKGRIRLAFRHLRSVLGDEMLEEITDD